ncbi:hypothetical protein G7Z17_g2467 [Cylindrodendrum hubeiense]|uniref:Geminivirus AL1 replication-associated protein central domain-containing protein n=1 Tax=Cylindrodendrum hubeiense TaxID=595255 RepID=A0A9P5HE69_9HYPO|nr:hypothetical protein G7Z17_g2467 [Cylindrodendrum hubeiense]
MADRGSPAVSDSGHDTEVVPRLEAPGTLQETDVFRLHASVVFVTYLRSRVEDPEEFHRLLRASVEAHLPKVTGTGAVGTVEVFGIKELPEDGCQNYHVVLRFDPMVCWKNAREKLQVHIDVGGADEVDTMSIRIRKKNRNEPVQLFLDYVQSYTAKDGVVFGTLIGTETKSALTRKEKWRTIIDAKTRSETVALFEEHFPEKWIFRHVSCMVILKMKEAYPAAEHVPSFKVEPWKVPAKMLQWKKNNFQVKKGGRPTCLVIIGPHRCGELRDV